METLHIMAAGRIAHAPVQFLPVRRGVPSFGLELPNSTQLCVYVPRGIPADPITRARVEARVKAYAWSRLHLEGD